MLLARWIKPECAPDQPPPLAGTHDPFRMAGQALHPGIARRMDPHYSKSTLLFIKLAVAMLADYLIHLEHHRVGRRVTLQVCVCGIRLPRIPAALAPALARLFSVPAQDLCGTGTPGTQPNHPPQTKADTAS